MNKTMIKMYDKARLNYGSYTTARGTYQLDAKGNLYLYFPKLDPVYGNKKLILTSYDYATAKTEEVLND